MHILQLSMKKQISQACYYHGQTNSFPFHCEVLGHVLGPAKGNGNEMAQWVLKANGRVVPCHTLHLLKPEEEHSPTEQKKCDSFNELVERIWGTSISPPKEHNESDKGDNFEEYQEDTEKPRTIPGIEDSVDLTEICPSRRVGHFKAPC